MAEVGAGTIEELREQYRSEAAEPEDVLRRALDRANSNAGKNVYLARDVEWSVGEARRLRREDIENKPLWGVPVSLKDCFDLSGFVTTCGSSYLAEQREVAAEDSAVAARLRECGAVITGKTHLHQLAYGITGENRDFGDCVQPGAAERLTGGSSSGAAASVMEGSAMAAIGTDTGGSIRVPAALCGLAGFRGSITLADANGDDLWRGGEHLAPSFDTMGWLYRDSSDGPLLGAALFGLPIVDVPAMTSVRVGVPSAEFLHDCEPEVLETLQRWMDVLQSEGAAVERFDASMWSDSMDIFAPVQASEAEALHPEPRDGFEPAIAERLRWGAALGMAAVSTLRERWRGFQERCEERLAAYDFVLLPACPVAELRAGEDHSGARASILRYTVPVSLLGWPAVTLPSERGGPQLAGKLGEDARLLAFSAELAARAARRS